MNLKEVSKRMPLKKFDIYESDDNGGILTYSECNKLGDAGSQSHSFRILYCSKYIDIERAFVDASDIYCNGLGERKSQSTTLRFKARTKIEIREYCRGRDGGSEWADPENDIVKSGAIKIAIFLDRPDDSQQYDVGFNPSYPFYGISRAYMTMIKMYESFLPNKKEAKNIVAFSWRDNVFMNPYIMFDQLCIAGTPYDTIEDNDSSRVKIDYLQDYVQFHKTNEIYGLGTKFFMNGKVIFTANDILQKFPNCSEYGIISNGFYEADKALEWIRKTYPQARGLHQTGMGASLHFSSDQHIVKEGDDR